MGRRSHQGRKPPVKSGDGFRGSQQGQQDREGLGQAGSRQPAATPEIALIQTLDFFTPIVNDPYTFDQIAAAGALDADGRLDQLAGITVPITTRCPCSKEISQVGAHNQRGEVRVQGRYRKFFWIEDLIRLAGESASCEVYALLKRQIEVESLSVDQPQPSMPQIRPVDN